MLPIMLVVDSAPTEKERMTKYALEQSQDLAMELGVGFLYVSPANDIYRI